MRKFLASIAFLANINESHAKTQLYFDNDIEYQESIIKNNLPLKIDFLTLKWDSDDDLPYVEEIKYKIELFLIENTYIDFDDKNLYDGIIKESFDKLYKDMNDNMSYQIRKKYGMMKSYLIYFISYRGYCGGLGLHLILIGGHEKEKEYSIMSYNSDLCISNPYLRSEVISNETFIKKLFEIYRKTIE